MSIPTMADALGAVNSGHGGYGERGNGAANRDLLIFCWHRAACRSPC